MPDQAGHLIPDKWLAARIGRNAYRLVVDEDLLGPACAGDRGRLGYVLSEPVFIYSKVNPVFAAGLRFLRQHRFDLVDTNVVFEKPIGGLRPMAQACQVRDAVPADREGVIEAARRSFACSRFHLDPAIPQEVANRIKADWAGNYFEGKRGQQMVVAVAGGQVEGFLQLLHGRDGTMTIDLIAVDERHRRKGMAREMVAFAEARAKGMIRVRVGTQIANGTSIRFYENLGFRFVEAGYVFHYHNG